MASDLPPELAKALRPALLQLTNSEQMPEAVRERARQLLAGETPSPYSRPHGEMMARPVVNY